MTKNTFILGTYSINSEEKINITKEDYIQIKNARKYIVFGQSFEEKLNLLIENYADFERNLFDTAITYSISPFSSEQILTEGRNQINRRLVNLFTSIKLYHDQLSFSLSRTFGKKLKEDFELFSAHEYDSSLGYRVVEALRNHVQHANLPITSFTCNMHRDTPRNSDIDSIKQSFIQFSAVPYIGVKYLEENKKFKKKVLQEIIAIEDKYRNIQIIPYIREYIQSIGTIHNKLRLLCVPKINESGEILDHFRNSFLEQYERDSESLAAIQVNNDGYYTNREYLTMRQYHQWKALMEKHKNFDNFAKRYISNNHKNAT